MVLPCSSWNRLLNTWRGRRNEPSTRVRRDGFKLIQPCPIMPKILAHWRVQGCWIAGHCLALLRARIGAHYCITDRPWGQEYQTLWCILKHGSMSGIFGENWHRHALHAVGVCILPKSHFKQPFSCVLCESIFETFFSRQATQKFAHEAHSDGLDAEDKLQRGRKLKVRQKIPLLVNWPITPV